MAKAWAWSVVALTLAFGFVAAGAEACSSSEGNSSSNNPPRETPDDPGCKVTFQAPADDPGHPLNFVHVAMVDASADADAGAGAAADASDASSADASNADADAAPGADADADDAAADAATLPPTTADSTFQADGTRTVACRRDTQLNAAAAPAGEVYVLGAGIRAQLVTTKGQDARAANVRLLDYLSKETSASSAGRVMTLPNGEPFVVTVSGRTLFTQEGSSPVQATSLADDPNVTTPTVSNSTPSANALGSILLPFSNHTALLRTSAGTISTLTLPDSIPSATGIGDDDKPFVIRQSETGSEVQTLGADGKRDPEAPLLPLPSAQAIRFIASGVAGLPPIVLLLDRPKREDRSVTIAVPSSTTSYALVPIVPAVKHCKPEPNCSNTCSESNAEVFPSEAALVRLDGTVYIVFVRRQVDRERRYTRTPASNNIFCDVFGCDPGCSSNSTSTTKSAELVVARVDLERIEAREVFALPMPVSTPTVEAVQIKGLSSTKPSESTPLRADGRDGFLHVIFRGDAFGFPGVSLYRFRSIAR